MLRDENESIISTHNINLFHQFDVVYLAGERLLG